MKFSHLFPAVLLSLMLLGCSGFTEPGVSPPVAPSEEDPTLFTYKYKTYKVVLEKMNWRDAADYADSHGGYLVEISSESEQNAVFDMVRKVVDKNYTLVADGGGVAYVWIGAVKRDTIWYRDGNDDRLGREFWYNQGTILDRYQNWPKDRNGKTVKPDNLDPFADSIGGQNYAAMSLAEWEIGPNEDNPSVMDKGEPGEWNDLAGFNELYFVIEGYRN